MDRKDIVPAIVGGLIGLASGLFTLVYLPMKRNYDECGTVTLCQPAQPKGDSHG